MCSLGIGIGGKAVCKYPDECVVEEDLRGDPYDAELEYRVSQLETRVSLVERRQARTEKRH